MNNRDKNGFIKNVDEEIERLLKERKEKQEEIKINKYIENGEEQLEIEYEDLKLNLNNQKIEDIINTSKKLAEFQKDKKPIDLTNNDSSNNVFGNHKVDEVIKEIDEKLEKLETKETNIIDIIEKIKNKLRKKTIIFTSGGIRPTNELYESWIGKVGWKLESETHPIDESGNHMVPLLTLFLEKLEYVPEALKGIKLITIFMSNDIWKNLSCLDYKNYFVIRTYENLDNIVSCNYISDDIKAFPLIPELKTNDFPQHDGLEDEMISFISELEEKENIEYYDDIVEETYYNHKLGGYPASIQGGVGYDEGFEFVLQIASDSKANLNIVDSGNFYFGYNPKLRTWSVRCDFY